MDLVKGTFNIRGTGGNILLSGLEEDPFFKVTTVTGLRTLFPVPFPAPQDGDGGVRCLRRIPLPSTPRACLEFSICNHQL